MSNKVVIIGGGIIGLCSAYYLHQQGSWDITILDKGSLDDNCSFGNAGRDSDPPQIWPLMEKNGTLTTIFFAMEQSRQPQRTYDLIGGLLARIGTGELRAVVDRTFPLSEAAEAHRYAEEGVAFGRVIMVP